MLIVAERINATRKPVREALERRDENFLFRKLKAGGSRGSLYRCECWN